MPKSNECDFRDRDALWFHLYAYGKSDATILGKIRDLRAEQARQPRGSPDTEKIQCVVNLLEIGLKKRQEKQRSY